MWKVWKKKVERVSYFSRLKEVEQGDEDGQENTIENFGSIINKFENGLV